MIEGLKKYFRKNKKVLIPFAFALLIGFGAGIVIQPNEEGMFFKIDNIGLSFGVTRSPLSNLELETLSDDDISILIGKISKNSADSKFGNELRGLALERLDLGQISDDDVAILIRKISRIPPDSKFGSELRGLAVKRGEVPFKNRAVPEIITITLVEDETMGKGFAKVCTDSPLYGQLLMVKNLDNPQHGFQSFRADKEQNFGCANNETKSNAYKMWVNKSKYQDQWWPDGESPESLTIKAKAYLVISDK